MRPNRLARLSIQEGGGGHHGDVRYFRRRVTRGDANGAAVPLPDRSLCDACRFLQPILVWEITNELSSCP